MSEQFKTLSEMKEKLESHKDELLDHMEENNYNSYDIGSYDIKILIGKEEFSLKYNADLHEGLENFIVEQIKIVSK